MSMQGKETCWVHTFRTRVFYSFQKRTALELSAFESSFLNYQFFRPQNMVIVGAFLTSTLFDQKVEEESLTPYYLPGGNLSLSYPHRQ